MVWKCHTCYVRWRCEWREGDWGSECFGFRVGGTKNRRGIAGEPRRERKKLERESNGEGKKKGKEIWIGNWIWIGWRRKERKEEAKRNRENKRSLRLRLSSSDFWFSLYKILITFFSNWIFFFLWSLFLVFGVWDWCWCLCVVGVLEFQSCVPSSSTKNWPRSPHLYLSLSLSNYTFCPLSNTVKQFSSFSPLSLFLSLSL